MGHLVVVQIHVRLECCIYLSPAQHGFRQKGPCASNLLLADAMSSGYFTGIIFVDLNKVIDEMLQLVAGKVWYLRITKCVASLDCSFSGRENDSRENCTIPIKHLGCCKWRFTELYSGATTISGMHQ